MIKRIVDLVAAALGLVALAPVLLLFAAWIRLDSAGPVFFRQERVGRRGVPFRIYKFRTMKVDTEAQGQITVGRDARITPLGHTLRHYKLDELPQLINVLLGDMSLVGPRPEVPKYVALYSPAQRDLVLSLRPGITDLASITYRDENRLLGESSNPERTYIEEVMPVKLAYYLDYVRNRSLALDLKIVGMTIFKLLR
ncbi:sugar transferase [Janthinobacterium sp.]|uniref:sugar transferase n=1 Tax=Janthinobacterium sp. TaxID=1871054 RepID=UPI00293D4CA7|nr:sugar transferase [Janthinobacterium sp.]